MIELREITKAYPTKSGSNLVLDHVSFAFPQNTNFGILGKNGAGTTSHFDLYGRVDIQLGTLSKALGVVGG